MSPGSQILVTLASVRSLAALREADLACRKDMKDTTKVPSIDAKDWPKTLKAIETYLWSGLGQKEIPLAYVVRREIAIPEADPSTNYRSRHAEMICRAPHGSYVNGVWVYDDTYIENSKIVFNIIAKSLVITLVGLMLSLPKLTLMVARHSKACTITTLVPIMLTLVWPRQLKGPCRLRSIMAK